MLVDDDSQSFETPRLNIQSVTVARAHILLCDDDAHLFETTQKIIVSLHQVTIFCWNLIHCNFKKKEIPYRPGQKLPPPVKEYIFFQMDKKTVHAAQCSKLRVFIKVIDLND